MKKLLGLTLIEMIITMSIVVILAGVTLGNMNKLRRPKDLVNEVTDTIVNTLNQANATSIATGATQDVCTLVKGTGTGTSGRAACDDTAGSWKNVNGSEFNQKVTVTILPAKKIIYKQGLIDNNTSIYTITVTSNTDATYNNVITVWPNSVVEIVRNGGN